MSKHQQKYIYNQPIYSDPNAVQNINYGTYQSSSYHHTTKQTKQTKKQEIVYQEQIIGQPQEQYIVEGNAYIPQTQYIQEGQYVIQDDQGLLYGNQQTGKTKNYKQQIYQQPGQQIIYQEQQPVEQVIYQEQQPGQQIIYQEQQPGQQIIYQEQQPGQQIVYQEQQPGQQIVYQEQLPGQQIIYQEQQPGQQIVYQEQLPGQQIIYQEQQPGQQIIYQEQQPGQQIVYQEQQPSQQIIYQGQYNQQLFEQNPKTIKDQRTKKYTQQMAKQKPNIEQKPPFQQQGFVSRNPHIKQQYQSKNIHQQYNQNIPQPKYIPQPQIQNQNQQKLHDKPSIEPEFAPDFQIANSVIGQIPFDPNQIPKKTNTPIQPKVPYQAQNQQNNVQPMFVIPRRNPNVKLTKYDLTNSSHYVNTSDPGSRTTKINTPNINNVNQIQSSDKGANMKSKITEEQKASMKYSIDPNFPKKEEQKEILNEEDKPEVGVGITCLGNSSLLNNESVNNINDTNINNNSINNKENFNNKIDNNIKTSNNNNSVMNSVNNKNSVNSNMGINNNVKISSNSKNNNFESNINMRGNEFNDNIIDNKMNHEETEKENPIEEKVPDETNMDNPINVVQQNYENYQPHYNAQEMHESKLKESVDIDDDLDHLPTVGSIMKGKSEMLPPPKKRKYQE